MWDRDLHSPILSAFYIAPIFHIFKERTLSPIPISILSFVDNRLLISQKKSYEKSNTFLFYSYNIISFLFSLVIKHEKLEVFHFSGSTKNINLPPLDL